MTQNNHEFEESLYSRIFQAFESKNNDELYLIVQMMQQDRIERTQIINNALILINSLFFSRPSKEENHPKSQYVKDILKTICS